LSHYPPTLFRETTRFLTLNKPHAHLILGPWNHGGSHNCSPVSGDKTAFDHGQELLRFFDAYLKGKDTGIHDEPRVKYYTQIEERWKFADTWDAGVERLQSWWFAESGCLRPDAPTDPDAADSYLVRYETGTGEKSRWKSLIGGPPVVYADRRSTDKALLTYTSPPLEYALEVSGHPLAQHQLNKTLWQPLT
jgi:hypothetical protein